MARIVPDVSTEPLNARPKGVKVRANSNGECFAEEIMDSLQKAPVCSSTGRMENILDEPSGGKGMRASRAGSLGTVYPTVRITDKWGILEVYAGALMSPDWKQVTVAAPADPSAHPLRGYGTLQLVQSEHLIRGPRPGDFSLQKEGQ